MFPGRLGKQYRIHHLEAKVWQYVNSVRYCPEDNGALNDPNTTWKSKTMSLDDNLEGELKYLHHACIE